MNCPNCGKELKEGKLYCEFCGNEIQMVPDFEPEIEIRMEESLMTVAESVSDPSMSHTKKMAPIFMKEDKESSLLDKEYFPEEPEEDEDDEEQEELLSDDEFWDVNEAIDFRKGVAVWSRFVHALKHNIKVRILTGIAVGVFCFLIVMLVVFITRTVEDNSFDYQYNQAKSFSQDGEYAKAAQCMERAVEIDTFNMDAKLELADCYNKSGQTSNAVLVLKELISYQGPNMMEAYTKLFQIYTEIGEFGMINKTLIECNNEAVQEHFQEYLAMPPEFSIEEGLYNDVQHLKLTAKSQGTIYYTLDGNPPDTSSDIYSAPIYLESGFITVSAYFVNEYGLASDVVSKRYEIDVLVPDSPKVFPESGEFQLPSMIMIDIPEKCKIYYTYDGSDPTTEDEEYTEPICMPLGTTNLSFVCVSENNILSDVVKRQYTLSMEAEVSAAEAANLVTNYRFSLGGLKDTDGHLTTVAGRLMYMCKGAVTISEQPYYFVAEIYEDPVTLIQTRTGLQYGVNAHTGQIVSMEMDELGFYYVIEAVSQPTVQ